MGWITSRNSSTLFMVNSMTSTSSPRKLSMGKSFSRGISTLLEQIPEQSPLEVLIGDPPKIKSITGIFM